MESCAFDVLFTKSVPHILEKIFISLDYESFKNCCKVSKAWNKLLTSESFQKKANVFKEKIKRDQDAVWWAVANGNAEKIVSLLSTGLVDVNYWYADGRYDDRDRDHSSDLSLSKEYFCRGYCHGKTLLSKAAMCGRSNVVKILLDEGAEFDKANYLGETPLYLAAWQNHPDAVQVLLDAGADPNRTNYNGCTPLHHAARNNFEMVKLQQNVPQRILLMLVSVIRKIL